MANQDKIIDKLLAKGWKPNQLNDSHPGNVSRRHYPVDERGQCEVSGWFYLISPNGVHSVSMNPEELILHNGKTRLDKIIFRMRYEQIKIKRNELLCDGIFSLKL